MSFAQWASRSRKLAAELSSRGVGPGDVVALMLAPGIDYAVAYVATLRLGAVVTGLNTRLGRLEVDRILAQCAPALVIYDQSTGLPAPAGLTVMYRDELTDACAGHPVSPIRWSGTADAPAVIIWTSGTTGHPKGAWFDHAGLAAAVASAGAVGGRDQRRLVATPFAHAGYMAKVWEQLANGTTFVLAPQPWTAESMARVLVEEQITVAGAVPTQWEKLLELPTLTPSRLAHLRIGVAATAAASPGAHRGGPTKARMPVGGSLCDDRIAQHHRYRARRSTQHAGRHCRSPTGWHVGPHRWRRRVAGCRQRYW